MGKQEVAAGRTGNVIEWIAAEKGTKVLLVTVSREADIRDREDEDEAAFLLAARTIFEKRGADVAAAGADDLQSLWDDKCFDLIILCGVLERQKSRHMSEEKVLGLLARHILAGGRLIAIEHNRMGAAYLSGHPMKKNRGISEPKLSSEGNGYTRKELLRIFERAGYKRTRLYYPYENEYETRAIYTDEWLPDIREEYHGRPGRERIALFDEEKFGSLLVEEGAYAPFSNAFLVEAYPAIPPKQPPVLQYARYSDNRKAEFALRTSIYAYPSGERAVTKTPLTGESFRHVNLLYTTYGRLAAYYKGYSLQIATCVKIENGVGFTFLKGKKLSDMINEMLFAGDVGRAARLMQRFTDVVMSPAKLSILDKKAKVVRFGEEKGFTAMFGPLTEYEEECLKGEEYLSLTDVDLNFDSVIVEDQTWTIYDYEWCVDFPVPFSYVLWRAIERHFHGDNAKLLSMEPDVFWDHFKMNENKRAIFARMARAFDRYVGREENPPGDPDEQEERVYTLDELIALVPEGKRANSVPVRIVYANGEVDRKLILPRKVADNGTDFCVFQLRLSGETKQIRISLSEGGGILSEVDVRDEKGTLINRQLSANATRSTGGKTYFFSPDAYLELAPKRSVRAVDFRYVWTPLPKEALSALKDLSEGGNANGKRNRRNLS